MKGFAFGVALLGALSTVHLSYAYEEQKEAVAKQGTVASVTYIPDDSSHRVGLELRDSKGQSLHILRHELTLGSVPSFEFSPDGKLIASAASTGGWGRDRTDPWPSILGEVRVWDTQTGELKRVFIEPNAQMSAVSFFPDGKTLAIGGGDGKIRLWNLITDKFHAVIPTSCYISSLDVSPDGKKLVAALGDKEIRIWSTATHRIWKVLDAEKEDKDSKWIYKAAFSPDGKIIASAGSDPLRWWDAKSGKLIKTFEDTRRETPLDENEQIRLVFPAAK